MKNLESEVEKSLLSKMKNGFRDIKNSAASKMVVYGLAGALSMGSVLGCDNGNDGSSEENNYSEIYESDEDLIATPDKDIAVNPNKDTKVTKKTACWEKIYETPGGIVNTMDSTNDGGIVVAGRVSTGGSGMDNWVCKFDKSGDIVWDQTFQGSNYPLIDSIQQTNDNGYIMALKKDFTEYGAWVTKLDSNGNLKWDKFFSDDSILNGPYSIDNTNDNGSILAGLTTKDGTFVDARVLKLDSSGNVSWDKNYSQGLDNSELNLIKQTNDSGYIAAGHTSIPGVGGYHAWVVKLNSSGNMEWDKYFQGMRAAEGREIQQTSDGGYALLTADNSSVKVLKLTSSGNLDWEKGFGNSKTFAYSIQQTKDLGYIVSGHNGETEIGGEGLVFKTDQNGMLEWDKTYSSGTSDKFFEIEKTNDGKYVVAGATNLNIFTQPWILKIDEKGSLNCD